MKCPKCGKDLLLRNEKVGENEDGSAIYNEFGICKDCKRNLILIKHVQRKQKEQQKKLLQKNQSKSR